jgi:hypothetical protein
MSRNQLPCSPGAHGRTPVPWGAGHQLGAVLVSDLLGLATAQHAPSAPGLPIDLVDLEGDVGVFGGPQDRPRVCPDDRGVPSRP